MEIRADAALFRRALFHVTVNDILEQHVVPISARIGPRFILMQDNARPHSARVVSEYLQDVRWYPNSRLTTYKAGFKFNKTCLGNAEGNPLFKTSRFNLIGICKDIFYFEIR